ncbi:Nucleolar pre-ribosomal-associated protein 1 [Myotis brandtii]|uniref:Nucleolar pre-ribosomal-associated protein 1 n=1 Tax=Myotis brandtii TaxID=109478 RepID=S7ML18_MYOBR|nr:Nucleolar pre-ribosomal-associated protein 1 [Myotis brandtii]
MPKHLAGFVLVTLLRWSIRVPGFAKCPEAPPPWGQRGGSQPGLSGEGDVDSEPRLLERQAGGHTRQGQDLSSNPSPGRAAVMKGVEKEPEKQKPSSVKPWHRRREAVQSVESGGENGSAQHCPSVAEQARDVRRGKIKVPALAQLPVPALEAFVAAAKQLPREGVYDVVEGYVKISVECAEVFQLLSGERPPESEVLLIFQALEAILLRTASDLSHLHVVGTNIVKKLLNNHMKLICEALYASGYRVARACLSLMTAMVTQGPEAARDVCSLFDLNKKTLYSLVAKRDSKGVHDVRLAYIQFALSFLIAGDDSTLVQVLELKGIRRCLEACLSELGAAAMSSGRAGVLLFTPVVHNKSITKTQKVRFFTGQLLTHIASLYSWNGIVDVDLGPPEEASAEDAGKGLVRERVHRFLTDLCCSLKHGINFYDASLGTSGRGGNLTLLHFLLGLRTAPDDELVAELVVSILRVCPDLLHKYFKEVTFSFLPRAKATWANNVKLLHKIYEAQPDVSRAFRTREFIPLSRLLAMVMVTTVPPVCNKIMFTQALNLDSKSVRHTALALLLFILKRALKTVDFCLSSEAWQGPGVYTAAMMEDFVRLFREALSKVFPDLNTVVWVWQSLRKQDTREGDEQARKQDSGAPTGEAAPGDDAETILLKAVLLQVVCLYQRVVPHVVTQYNFDFSKLLRGVISEQGLREEVPPVLQHHLLQVALELPACKFSWLAWSQEACTRTTEPRLLGPGALALPGGGEPVDLLSPPQEGPEAELLGGERSVFYLLMKMFVASAHSQLKLSTKRLIVKVLLTLVASPYAYTDKASDFVQEASTLQAAAKQDADDASIPISHIDDVLDMVDVLVEGSEGLDEEIGCSLSKDMALLTFPFSPVAPAALEARNKLLLGTEREAGASVVAYLTAVLTDLLHSQRDPLALCLLLQAYDQLAPPVPQLSCFSSYYRLWIPEPAQEAALPQTPHSPTPQDPPAPSFGALLQAAFRSEDKAALLDEAVQARLRDAVPHLPMHHVLLSVKHVLLYLRTSVERFRQLLLGLLRRLVLHCAQLDAQNREKCEAAGAEDDLFLDVESAASLELASDTVLWLPMAVLADYLQRRTQGRPTRPAAVPSAVVPILRKALWRRLQTRLLGADGPSEAGLHPEVLAQLVPFARAKDLGVLKDRLPSSLQTPDGHKSWIVADAVSAALEGAGAELRAWREKLLESCVKWLVGSFGGRERGQDGAQGQEEQMLLRLRQLLSSADEVGPGDWQQFVKTGLKHRYQDPAFLREAGQAVGSLVAEVWEGLWAEISLSEPGERGRCAAPPAQARSEEDQKILLLLRAYEHNSLSLVSFSLGKSLWQQPSAGDILRLLDRDQMMKTILHFPQNRRLLPPEDTQDPIFRDGSPGDLDGLYDPCFLLHLFSELTRPELVVDCRKFVDSNALGLTAAALSSYDPQMRAAAYSVLAAYYSHVEGARFREQPQVLYLLDVVRNGIRTQNMRLTFTLALFVAKAALQILKPGTRGEGEGEAGWERGG